MALWISIGAGTGLLAGLTLTGLRSDGRMKTGTLIAALSASVLIGAGIFALITSSFTKEEEINFSGENDLQNRKLKLLRIMKKFK